LPKLTFDGDHRQPKTVILSSWSVSVSAKWGDPKCQLLRIGLSASPPKYRLELILAIMDLLTSAICIELKSAAPYQDRLAAREHLDR